MVAHYVSVTFVGITVKASVSMTTNLKLIVQLSKERRPKKEAKYQICALVLLLICHRNHLTVDANRKESTSQSVGLKNVKRV